MAGKDFKIRKFKFEQIKLLYVQFARNVEDVKKRIWNTAYTILQLTPYYLHFIKSSQKMLQGKSN